MDKNDIIDKLERLINKEITIGGKIYSGMKGILRNYNIGEEHEDAIALVDVILVTGRKVKVSRTDGIWMDATDILEVGKK